MMAEVIDAGADWIGPDRDSTTALHKALAQHAHQCSRTLMLKHGKLEQSTTIQQSIKIHTVESNAGSCPSSILEFSKACFPIHQGSLLSFFFIAERQADGLAIALRLLTSRYSIDPQLRAALGRVDRTYPRHALALTGVLLHGAINQYYLTGEHLIAALGLSPLGERRTAACRSQRSAPHR